MGKKQQRVQVESDEEENLLNDPDFEAEMKALESLRAEREQEQQGSQESTIQTKTTYNRDGLIKCLQDLETVDLSFVETLCVNEFDLQINNELDDVEREVSLVTVLLFS